VGVVPVLPGIWAKADEGRADQRACFGGAASGALLLRLGQKCVELRIVGRHMVGDPLS